MAKIADLRKHKLRSYFGGGGVEIHRVVADGVEYRDEVQTVTVTATAQNEIQTVTLNDVVARNEIQTVTLNDVVVRNEIQLVTTDGASGGNFTLTFQAQETANIAWNADAATVTTRLEALNNVGVGDVAVTGNAGGPWTVEFQAGLGNQNVGEMTLDPGTLADQGPGIGVTTTQGGLNGGTWTLTFDGDPTGPLVDDITGADLQVALRALPSINGANVTVTGDGPYTVEFIGALGNADQPPLVPDPSPLTGTVPDPSIDILTTQGGLDGGTWTLDFDGDLTAALAYNVSGANLQVALRALPSVGGSNLTVAGNGPYTVEFIGTLALADQPALVADDSLLTGSGPVPTIDVVETQGGLEGGTFKLRFGGETTDDLDYDAAATAVRTELRALDSIDGANVNVTGAAGGPYTCTFVGTLAKADVGAITAPSNTLTGIGAGVLIVETTKGASGDVEIAGLQRNAVLLGVTEWEDGVPPVDRLGISSVKPDAGVVSIPDASEGNQVEIVYAQRKAR